MKKEAIAALLKRLEVLQNREHKLDILRYEQTSFIRWRKASMMQLETEKKIKRIERLINK